MTDIEILDLYQQRDESAIDETAKQYGAYCTKIAMNILHNSQDAEECVNDAYLNAWSCIPPKRPLPLSTFLGRITRNIAINRHKARKAKKRTADDTALLLSELEGCIPSAVSVEDEFDAAALEGAIEVFLSTLPENDRRYFIRRYWYADTCRDIAKRFGVGEGRVRTNLHRTRSKLKIQLEKEGIVI